MSQRPIQRLSKEVVDRIAAGEVVQRPSAALKELMENSIDAKSRRIGITVQDGGLTLLQITDDGSGINEGDLPLLCERFATSKLTHFDDLLAMATFGFRGEALASISHVARISVTTKTSAARCALKVSYADGKMLSAPRPAAGNAGTVMVIEELFYNMQVRRKAMLPKASEEHSRIIDVIVRYAFAFPHIGFSLKKLGNSTSSAVSGGGPSAAALASAKIEFNFPEKSTTIANLRQYYGNAITKALHPFEFSEGGAPTNENSSASTSHTTANSSSAFPISFTGYASDVSLSHRRPIFILFINKRLVESSALKRTIDQAYGPYLVNDNKPFVFLDVSVDPSRLDVNVHPTKHEVLLLDEERLCAALHRTLTDLIRGLADRLVAGNVSSRGNKTMLEGAAGPSSSAAGGRAMLGSAYHGGAGAKSIDPQVLNLKPVAGLSVQVAPSTVSRTVAQRGDLLRLFKSAKEREEQQRLGAEASFEDGNYFNTTAAAPNAATTMAGTSVRPPPPPPFIVPTRPDAPITTLRVDEVLDMTDLCDDDDDEELKVSKSLSLLGGGASKGAAAAVIGSKRAREGDGEGAAQLVSSNPSLLSLVVGGDDDDDSNSNIALAFPAIGSGDSDDDDDAIVLGGIGGGQRGATAGTRGGGGGGSSSYDDADGAMRLASAMSDFNAYLAAQKKNEGGNGGGAATDGALATTVSSAAAARAGTAHPLLSSQRIQQQQHLPPPPSIPAVQLEFVSRKLQSIAANSCAGPEARHLFKSLVYVGVLNHEHILAQSGTSLLMLDWRPIVRAVAYQRLVTRWGRHRLATLVGGGGGGQQQQGIRVVDALAFCEDARRRALAAKEERRQAKGKEVDSRKRRDLPLPPISASLLLAQLATLYSWKDMFAEYFGIILMCDEQINNTNGGADGGVDQHQQQQQQSHNGEHHRPSAAVLASMRLVALPILVGERWPINQHSVPWLLHGLAGGEGLCSGGGLGLGGEASSGRRYVPARRSSSSSPTAAGGCIDYSDESACFEGILRLVSNTIGSGFFFQCPSATAGGGRRGAVPPSSSSSSSSSFINSVDAPRMIMTYPQCHDAFVDAVQGALLPSLTSSSLFHPPTVLLTDGTIKSVVTVEALYKVFERC